MATCMPSALSATVTRPSLVARPDFLAALAMPFWRSQSMAFSRSPPTSSRAFLQSIMPAPVLSRRSFTIWALIAIVCSTCPAQGPEFVCHRMPPGRKGAVDNRPSCRTPQKTVYRAASSSGDSSARVSCAAAFCMASSASATSPLRSLPMASPSMQASAKAVTKSLMARMASSLPGMM